MQSQRIHRAADGDAMTRPSNVGWTTAERDDERSERCD